VLLAPSLALAWTPLATVADPLVRQPGTQPGGATLQSPQGCFDCHWEYAPSVEQGFGWRGSTMAQSARDAFFWAGMAVAAQDSIYAFGRPNAADTCERCHLPKGWLEHRSDPPNGSLMTGNDFDGVQCDFCHRLVDPFAADTFAGLREGNDWLGYWDETNLSSTPSQAAAMATLAADEQQLGALRLFDGAPLYDATSHLTAGPGFDENGGGQYFVSADPSSRGPFADGSLPHTRLYSRYHKSKFICSTCHDVSNTALANASFASVPPGDGATVLPTESQPAHGYAPLERTFSEFMLSDFGLPGGAQGQGAFAGVQIVGCQDCHMPSATGTGSNFPGGLVRPTGSAEHPNTGVPVHDMTGGNALLPFLLASTVPGSPGYDATNAALLGQGPAVLTLDLTQGLGLDALSLLAARNRTLLTLSRAASVEALAYDPTTGAASFRVRNHTGHKLLTGYAEGRRMFLRVELYQGQTLLQAINPYDVAAGTLRGLPKAYSPSSPPLGAGEVHRDDLVYEARPSSTITGESETFHFVLSTGISRDNRIPPRGFRIAEAAARGAEPAWAGAAAPGLFAAAEYAGGYRDVTLALPAGGDRIVVELDYQATSREYVEFLRDEIEGTGKTLASPTPSGEVKAYVAQTDPFFDKLRAWGDTIWQLWQHNKDAPGAAPIVMTRAVLALDTCGGKPDGTPCDDGDACTGGDACQGGACHGGAAIGCDDGNECTDDGCDPQAGCVHAFNAITCEDGDLCTAPDSCAFGVCVPGPLMDCKDKEYCTLDSCDPATGCVHAPNPDPACPVDAGADGAGGGASSSSTGAVSSSASGSASSSGGGAGGAGGTAAASSGHAASSSGAGGGGGTGGSAPPAGAGCGCEVVREERGPAWIGAPLALLALGLRRRRGAREK
jgi:hypothetical protein